MIQFILLLIIIAVVYAIGYKRGKVIKEREVFRFAKDFDRAMTVDLVDDDETIPISGTTSYEGNKYGNNDDFFTGNIARSSRTETNKDV